MSAQEELEKLRNMRAELEAESRSLEEQLSCLENNVISLEEKIAIEELKKEKAAIEELKNHNKVAKDAVAKLESKKKKLENKLEKTLQKPEEPSPKKQQAEEEFSKPEENEIVADGGVVVTAIEGEALEEQLGIAVEDSPEREKKKRRFF